MNRRERRAYAKQIVRKQPGMNGADVQRARSRVARDLANLPQDVVEDEEKPFSKFLNRRKSGLIVPK